MHTHIYTVKGHGPFPIDMLRRDRSFPLNEVDANRITHTLTDHHGHADSHTVVDLVHYGDPAWTPRARRWQSFGWHVISQQVL